jgi:hypothetical protein
MMLQLIGRSQARAVLIVSVSEQAVVLFVYTNQLYLTFHLVSRGIDVLMLRQTVKWRSRRRQFSRYRADGR